MRPVKRIERPKYERPTIVELPKRDDRQRQAGTLPPNAQELGHKGRSWRAR